MAQQQYQLMLDFQQFSQNILLLKTIHIHRTKTFRI